MKILAFILLICSILFISSAISNDNNIVTDVGKYFKDARYHTEIKYSGGIISIILIDGPTPKSEKDVSMLFGYVISTATIIRDKYKIPADSKIMLRIGDKSTYLILKEADTWSKGDDSLKTLNKLVDTMWSRWE